MSAVEPRLAALGEYLRAPENAARDGLFRKSGSCVRQRDIRVCVCVCVFLLFGLLRATSASLLLFCSILFCRVMSHAFRFRSIRIQSASRSHRIASLYCTNADTAAMR